MIAKAEYMIKEAWPKYLNSEYCTRMVFDITPKTSGFHILSIITTGRAICYIDGEKVFVREQETDLKPESFYFFKSKLERRFTHRMVAGQRYTLTLESWATEESILHAAPLFGKMFQGASLRFFEYVDIDYSIALAAKAAKESEYAIVCTGTTNETESEGYDRETMNLPGMQDALVRAVAAANRRTIVINFSGAPVTMDFVTHVAGIVQAWYPGQECGHSVVKILLGATNPSARLPMSWPKRIEDNPSFGNFPAKNNLIHYQEGLNIGYRYYDQQNTPDPLFPFGFGLSYTTFEISNAQASHSQIPGTFDDTVEISCSVTNTGHLKGKSVVQFYVQMPETTLGLRRPLKELKAFTKVEVDAGQQVLTKVILDRYSFSVYDAESSCWKGLQGVHKIHVGTSSCEISATVNIAVAESFTWTGV